MKKQTHCILQISLVIYIVVFMQSSYAQEIKWEDNSLNTARNADYMQPEEREMVYEINRLRSDPSRYAKTFITIRLNNALKELKEFGKGNANYSLTTYYEQNKPYKVDTTWHFVNEELLRALQTLYDTLIKMKPLSILFPDEGIYNACIKHAKDQGPTNNLNHQGRDGSWPYERIMKFSPKMVDGNENLAYNGNAPARIIVLQLLVDEGIPGYGHRYNMLGAGWTHVACYFTRPPLMKSRWWMQEFGKIGAK